MPPVAKKVYAGGVGKTHLSRVESYPRVERKPIETTWSPSLLNRIAFCTYYREDHPQLRYELPTYKPLPGFTINVTSFEDINYTLDQFCAMFKNLPHQSAFYGGKLKSYDYNGANVIYKFVDTNLKENDKFVRYSIEVRYQIAYELSQNFSKFSSRFCLEQLIYKIPFCADKTKSNLLNSKK